MSDQCQHCTLQGQDVNRCHTEGDGTPCYQTESWYARTLRAQRDELYEACQNLVVAIYNIQQGLGTKFPALAEAWVMARAALAKVEGEGK